MISKSDSYIVQCSINIKCNRIHDKHTPLSVPILPLKLLLALFLQTIQRGQLNLEFSSGAVYMIVVTENRGNASSLVEEGEQYKVTGVEIDEPNSVSIFLQVPMYVVITAAEIIFSITGLEFAYSQVSNEVAILWHGLVPIGHSQLL